MKRDGVNRMLSFAKLDISEWGSRHEPKIINRGGLNKVCRQLPLSIKHPQVVVLLLLVLVGHTKHYSIYKYIYFGNFWRLLTKNYSGAVNPNTPHCPPVCSIFNEIVQFFNFSRFPPVSR